MALFYILLLIDVFMPAILFEISGLPVYPAYYGYISEYDLLKSVFIFVVAAFFFTLGYRTKVIRLFENKPYFKNEYQLNYKLLYIFYLITVFNVILNGYIEIRNLGGFENYYDFKIKRVYLETMQSANIFEKIVFLISSKSSSLLILLNSLLFYNRFNYNKKILWGLVIPLITFLLILTGLHRGTILNFFISLIVVEIFRMQKTKHKLNFKISKKIKNRFVAFGLVSVIFFLTFGAIRGRLNSSVWGNEITFFESLLLQIQNNFGISLLALARVQNYFSSNENWLLGQTIFEMLYFFVPRPIFPEKPIQYGIISANTIMGSPSSTMDAITIPGEMIANFGLLGVVLVFAFGYFYKLLKHWTYNEQYIPVYATLITTVTVTFWMSFTGLFSQMIYLPVYMVIIKILFKKVKV
ncbi:O-antigen polymerase [Jeotgalibacillus soli]|uniref:O-antigen polymerase n=1 Tax=Jeotgalibacillus soli TaxID=889306 RepID=UPI001F16128B|nr:O-antigen polymerase [Jeotgalibacillus soli]